MILKLKTQPNQHRLYFNASTVKATVPQVICLPALLLSIMQKTGQQPNFLPQRNPNFGLWR